ncbi:MAG: chemotaxis protein [Rhizobacter sp.]
MKSLRHTLMILSAGGILAAAVLSSVNFATGQRSLAAVDRIFVAKDVVADILPPPLYLIEMRLLLSQMVEGSTTIDKSQKEFARLEKEYNERIRYWTENPPYELQKELFGASHEAGKAFIEGSRAILKMFVAGDIAAANAEMQVLHQLFVNHRNAIDNTVQVATAFSDAANAQNRDINRNGTWSSISVLLFALVGLVGLTYWARRSIFQITGGEPSAVATIANAVADGNLSVQVPVVAGDNSSVMAAMARMCKNLTRIVDQVRASSELIASGASQIADSNMDLSKRTEQQASSLQSTASAMEQIASTVAHNADTSRQANTLAATASDVAERGGEVVNQVVSTMQDITNSSRKINDIIGVIDGIAFQTNILALNAAVEAARAGEQGRGFAVVAGEVRSLAQRSAVAAKEIKTLIGSSVEKVDAGAKLVTEAGATMEEIVQQVKHVTSLIGEISNATTEQTQGVSQVGEAITILDQTTQQNTALVEESAAAAENLSQQAQELVTLVRMFKSTQA